MIGSIPKIPGTGQVNEQENFRFHNPVYDRSKRLCGII